ncbi:MAG TPA: glycosyltransferase [Puia sp.]|jgi:glycosyltransferase involved in cell wall biosynthesis|nr:glycosyltransferase [Puia sp.]
MNKNEKTFVVLSPGFPANEADTTCLPSQQLLIKAINKNSPWLNIVILSFRYPCLNATYRWNNNKVVVFGGLGKGKIFTFLTWFRVWKTLKQLSRDNGIAGILSFWCGECALVGKWFGQRHNIKHYTWISGQDAKKGNVYVKWIRPKPNELIAMSDFLAREYYKNFLIRPAFIIPIGIAPELYNSQQPERVIDVMGAGSLIPLKQYDLFVRVVKKLSFQFPAINAVIFGNGPEKKNLEALIAQHHLENNISLSGVVDHPDLLGSMQQARVFLHTSSYEGFGAVCIEALYAGAQVVGFCRPMDKPINRWHIVGTEEEMCNKIQEILQNTHTSYQPELPFLMSETAKEMMSLFD